MESFVSVQRQINSSASVALQNRRALDLFTSEKGGTCLFLGEDCCYFVNETGIVQGRVKELKRQNQTLQKSYKIFPLPKAYSKLALPWFPFLGTIGTYHFTPLIWTQFLQSLSKVPPRPDLGSLSSPSQDHSPQEPRLKEEKETLGPRTVVRSRPRAVTPTQQEVTREIRHPFPPSFYDFRVWNEGVLGPGKRRQPLQRPMLNHLTSGKTKLNLKSHPDTLGRLHQPETFNPPPPFNRELPSAKDYPEGPA